MILTGDHGFQLGEHGLWFKNYLFNGSTQIPLSISDPRRPHSHGQTSHALVEQPDLFPTLCDLLDLKVDQAFEGESLVPLLEDTTSSVKDASFSQVNWGPVQGRSMRTDDFLYVRWSGDLELEELYDLKQDPEEDVDLLYGGKTHPAIEDLRSRFEEGWSGSRAVRT